MRLATSSIVRIVGLAVVLGLVLAIYLALTASTGLPGQSFRMANADFSDVGGLRVGDDVRTASVRIGQVRQISFIDGKARVELALNPDQPVYQDASALVVARSALGQNFVMLDPGSARSGALPSGGSLQDSRVKAPVELDQVLSVFTARTRAGTASFLRQAGEGAAGHSQDLSDVLKSSPRLLRDLQVVSSDLADRRTDLSGLLQSSAQLASRFDGRSAEIGHLMGDLDTTMSAIGVDDGRQVDGILAAAPPALDNTTKAMADLRGPLTDLGRGMRSLHPGAAALGRATPDLRAALRESVPVLDKVKGVATLATPAAQSLSNVMLDARPLARHLGKTMSNAARTTAVLAPYMPEVIRFFEDWNSANQYGDASGHYLRIALVVRPESITGVLPVRDLLVHRDPYPAPGQATRDRSSSLLGGGE
ncbi:MAG TPA: MlaD family protein [Nocardioides sp.]|nr:MlaD family protein [Nocardioides sp.]